MHITTVYTILILLILVQVVYFVKSSNSNIDDNAENNWNKLPLDKTIEQQIIEENEKLKLENQRMLSFLSIAEQQNAKYSRSNSGFEVPPNCNEQGMCESKQNRELMVKCEDTEYIRFCLETCRNTFVQCNKVSSIALDHSRTARYERRVKEMPNTLTECEIAAHNGMPLPAGCPKDDFIYVPPRKKVLSMNITNTTKNITKNIANTTKVVIPPPVKKKKKIQNKKQRKIVPPPLKKAPPPPPPKPIKKRTKKKYVLADKKRLKRSGGGIGPGDDRDVRKEEEVIRSPEQEDELKKPFMPPDADSGIDVAKAHNNDKMNVVDQGKRIESEQTKDGKTVESPGSRPISPIAT